MKELQQVVAIGVLAFMGWFGLTLLQAHAANVKRQEEGSPPDQAFCEEWLHYYENFCTVYPKHCVGTSPRKKARCDQAWDKK